MNQIFKVSLLALVFIFGCTKGESKDPVAAATPAPKAETNSEYGDPVFAKKTIKIGDQTLTVEIADDEAKRSHGLMFRTAMGENEGMLFVFDTAQDLGFWMRNTRIPLQIAYIGADKKIIDLIEMVPAADSDPHPAVYPSSKPAKYALEMNKGWFTQHKIKVGQLVQLD